MGLPQKVIKVMLPKASSQRRLLLGLKKSNGTCLARFVLALGLSSLSFSFLLFKKGMSILCLFYHYTWEVGNLSGFAAGQRISDDR